MKRNLAILFLLIIVGSTTDDRCLGAGGAEAGELQEPPTGSAPPGDVIRPGHLGRQIGDTECIIHFYHDLIGLGLRGTRTQPRPFNTRYGLLEFVQRGQGVPNPFDAYNRAAILPIPGTASTADGTEMAIEAIEIKGIASRPVRYLLNDPGASHLGLIVRDLDKTLAVLKDERVPVITRGGNPVVLPSWPGMRGKSGQSSSVTLTAIRSS